MVEVSIKMSTFKTLCNVSRDKESMKTFTRPRIYIGVSVGAVNDHIDDSVRRVDS